MAGGCVAILDVLLCVYTDVGHLDRDTFSLFFPYRGFSHFHFSCGIDYKPLCQYCTRGAYICRLSQGCYSHFDPGFCHVLILFRSAHWHCIVLFMSRHLSFVCPSMGHVILTQLLLILLSFYLLLCFASQFEYIFSAYTMPVRGVGLAACLLMNDRGDGTASLPGLSSFCT